LLLLSQHHISTVHMLSRVTGSCGV